MPQLENIARSFRIDAERYDLPSVVLVVDLVDGRIMNVPLAWFPELEASYKNDERSLDNYRWVDNGAGILWPALGYELTIASLCCDRSDADYRVRRVIDSLEDAMRTYETSDDAGRAKAAEQLQGAFAVHRESMIGALRAARERESKRKERSEMYVGAQVLYELNTVEGLLSMNQIDKTRLAHNQLSELLAKLMKPLVSPGEK